jgi:hypothetical protein
VSAGRERVREELREHGLVLFAAGLRRRDDGAPWTGKRLQKRAARARGVDEHDALRFHGADEPRVVVGREVGARKVERAQLAVETAVPNQNHDHFVVRLGLRGQIGERLFDVRAGRSPLDAAARVPACRRDTDGVVLQPALIFRNVDDGRRPLLKLLRMLVVPGAPVITSRCAALSEGGVARSRAPALKGPAYVRRR